MSEGCSMPLRISRELFLVRYLRMTNRPFLKMNNALMTTRILQCQGKDEQGIDDRARESHRRQRTRVSPSHQARQAFSGNSIS